MSNTTSRWASVARRLARADLGSDPWVDELRQLVDAASDDDLGTLLIAREVFIRAADHRQAAIKRQEAEDAAYREVQEILAREARHLTADRWIIGVALAAGMSVMLPWVLGNLLRDSFLLPTRVSIDSEARGTLRTALGDYFLSYYLAGLCVILFVAAALLLLRTWRGRRIPVTIGAVLLVGSLFAEYFAVQHWNAEEAIVDANKSSYTLRFCSNAEIQAAGEVVRTWIEIGGARYSASAHAYLPENSTKAPDTSRCNRITADGIFGSPSVSMRQLSQINLGEQSFFSSGTLCDTNGTPEGIIWYTTDILPKTNNIPGYYHYNITDSSAESLTFTNEEQFAQQYPKCVG